jgi:hypothetical protein
MLNFTIPRHTRLRVRDADSKPNVSPMKQCRRTSANVSQYEPIRPIRAQYNRARYDRSEPMWPYERTSARERHELIHIDTSVRAITSQYEFDARNNERFRVVRAPKATFLGLHTRESCSVAHAALANAPKPLTLNKRARGGDAQSPLRIDLKFCVRPPLRDHHIRDEDFIGPHRFLGVL